MKLFQSLQTFYAALSIYPTQSEKRSSFNFHNLFIPLNFSVLFIFQIGFFLFKAKDIVEHAETFYSSLTILGCNAIFVAKFCEMPKILILIGNFERFIEKRSQNSKSKAMYIEVKEKIEQRSKLVHFVLTKFSLLGLLLPSLLTTLINYLFYDLGADTFYWSSPMMLPFDWRNPIGYAIAMIIFAEVTFYILYCGVVGVCLLVGSCWLIQTIVQDIALDVAALNVPKRKWNQNRMEMKITFNNFIDDFSHAKRFVGDFNEIYAIIFTAIFLWSILLICCSLLAVQFELSNTDSVPAEMIRILFLMFWSIFVCFLVCEFGEMITNEFESFDFVLGQCNWYRLPIELQRMFVTVIANTQQTKILQAFGNTPCTRENFKKTISASFSYFMTLRQIDG